MQTETGLKRYFGNNLAQLLTEKISTVHPSFEQKAFLAEIKKSDILKEEMISRTVILAEYLRKYLPNDYPKAISILISIYGPENEKETGMFTYGYWLWPIAKFIEKYGLDDFELSIKAIEEITKRHTGEFAVRPFIQKYPEEMVKVMFKWAQSPNFHVRRLASEGIRPRLPWAQKLTIFIDNPSPVFNILNLLKDDPSKFVQRSVANNINDYLKDNRTEALKLVESWKSEATTERLWIVKHALRNESKRNKLSNKSTQK